MKITVMICLIHENQKSETKMRTIFQMSSNLIATASKILKSKEINCTVKYTQENLLATLSREKIQDYSNPSNLFSLPSNEVRTYVAEALKLG